MDISFEQLKSMMVFAQIVEQGSFTGAAKQLEISRAVVSYHLKKLEAQLEIKLLNRSTRAISLTQAGSDYYRHCRAIAREAASANREIENLKKEPAGLLKVTCPVNVGLQIMVPVLSKFRRLYPKINIDLMLSDDVVNILREGVDLAIRGAPLVDSGLQARKLATLTTCLCASVDYLADRGRPTTISDLQQHDWVVYKIAPNRVNFHDATGSHSVEIRGALSTNNAAARTAFVEGGHGIARIPVYDAQPKIKSGVLEQVLAQYQLDNIDLYAVFPPGTASSKKLRLFLDYLKAYFDEIEELVL